MKSCKTIRLPEPVCEVRHSATVSPDQAARRQQDSEQNSYERGCRDGEKALSQQLLQQRAELLELHQGAVASLRAVAPRVSQETEKALAQLAIEIAQKVIAGIPVTAKMVEAVVREAVSQVEDTTEMTVHLHPDDLALLRKHQSPILEGAPEAGPLRFTNSSDVTRGGCVVHTRFGLLDARRESKLEQLRQSFPA